MTISTWMRASLSATIWCLTLGAWGQGAPVATSSFRGEICLNGVWRFMPAIGPAAQSPTGNWGQIPVPGSWAGGAVPGPTATGRGGPWDLAELGDVSRAWYETSVTVPAEWDGRSALLELTRVSTDALVYANDLECGHIQWPSGTVDITRAVRAGEPVRLRLLVAAVPEGQDVTVYMGVGNDQTWTQPAQLASRGVTGEAFLRSRPAGAHVSDVFARPSVRDRSLSLDVELTGVAQAGEASFTARMLDATGRLEKTFTATRTVTAAAIQTVTLAWSWPAPPPVGSRPSRAVHAPARRHRTGP